MNTDKMPAKHAKREATCFASLACFADTLFLIRVYPCSFVVKPSTFN